MVKQNAEQSNVIAVALGQRVYLPGADSRTTVQPKCEESRGQWVCITHQERFGNQLQKDIHIHNPVNRHVLAWRCFAHGVEVP
jgi:hypothetical protein